MTKLRGVAIGAGYFSQFHFDAWSRIDAVDLTAVCDVDPASAERAAETYGIAGIYSDFGEMLDTEKPDFVDIITRPDSHLELVQQAAARRIAIICQKPLAPALNEARQLVTVAEEAGVPLMVHENFRFQPWYREIRTLLDEGAIGTTLHSLSFRMRTGDGYGPDAYLARQPYFREMPRFLIHETGVHFIDTFRYLGGNVTSISAVLRRLNPAIRGEDAGLLTFHFENGAVGTWDASRCHESTAQDPRYTFGTLLVEADKGSIRLNNEGSLFVKRLGEPEIEHVYEHSRRGFAGDCVFFTQQHFIDCLQNQSPFETSGSEYLKTLELVDAAYESAGAGSEAPSARLFSSKPRIVDLSLPVTNGMRGVDISTATTIADKGWNSTTLSLYSHCGTHMDAPKHFLGDEGATIDQQDLSVCCGPARVIDLTPVEPRELITVERLESAAGTVCPGDRLLLRTDWSHRIGTDAYREELPRISKELAEWLAAKQVALIGVEAPSVADVNDLREVTEVHQILFRGNVVIVEGLVNLDQLKSEIIEFIALPLKVSDGDGSPVRAIAIEQT